MTGAEALIRHLRENPGQHDPTTLAEQFQLAESVVQIALRQLGGSPAPSKPAIKRKKERSRILAFLERATADPVRFLVYSDLAALVVLPGLSLIPRQFLMIPAIGTSASRVVFLLALLVFPIAQIAGIARHGKSRYALLGALLYAVVMLVSVVVSSRGLSSIGSAMAATTAFTFLYILLGVSTATVCSYMIVARERKARRNISRQEAVERILELRDQLENQPGHVATPGVFRKFLGQATRFAAPIAAVLSFGISTVNSMFLVSIDPERRFLSATTTGSRPSLPASAGLWLLLMVVLAYGSVFLVGFLSNRFKGTALTIVGWLVGSLGSSLLPFAYLHLETSWRMQGASVAIGYVMNAALIVVGALVRQVYEHALVAKRTNAWDPEVLMAELIDLESLVSGAKRDVFVMAADVAGSTALKEGLDPLVVEWTFRAYQTMVDEIVQKFGGQVHATAGDGTIVGFPDAESALEAARTLLDSMEGFNRDTNRTKRPFRIRIGLHRGDAVGELRDVQFTRVIDIAAHLEGFAPIGGIAASEAFVAALDRSEFLDSGEDSDGQRVWILDPS